LLRENFGSAFCGVSFLNKSKNLNIGKLMRKAIFVDLLGRRLGCRTGRLTSLVQRATESGALRTNASKRPDFDIETDEIGRMVLLAAVDEGLANAGRTIERYGGGLRCAAINSNLETTLGHTLTRPERVPPSHSSLTIFTGDAPSAILAVATPDGIREYYFAGSANVLPGGVERTVKIGGAALFGIAHEISGTSPADVDRLLECATEMKQAASAVIN
jgi:hypothetical protein